MSYRFFIDVPSQGGVGVRGWNIATGGHSLSSLKGTVLINDLNSWTKTSAPKPVTQMIFHSGGNVFKSVSEGKRVGQSDVMHVKTNVTLHFPHFTSQRKTLSSRNTFYSW